MSRCGWFAAICGRDVAAEKREPMSGTTRARIPSVPIAPGATLAVEALGPAAHQLQERQASRPRRPKGGVMAITAVHVTGAACGDRGRRS